MHWTDTFREWCDKMRKDSIDSKVLPDKGSIQFEATKPCPKCNSPGVYVGKGLDTEFIDDGANASYCGGCNSFFDIDSWFTKSGRFDPESYLPILRGKLMENQKLLEYVKPSNPCPKCETKTYIFEKDLGLIDYYRNYWTVCINPPCTWPGSHNEFFSCS